MKADALTVEFRLGAGTADGPIVIKNQAGSAQLTGPFTATSGSQHPGFFVVSGPSVVQSVSSPGSSLADGDIVLVKGQNLARLGGICVLGMGLEIELRRVGYGSSVLADITSNSEMQVRVPWVANIANGAAVQLLAPSTPPGDVTPSSFACAPNGTSVIWPPVDPAAPPTGGLAATALPVMLSLTTSSGATLGAAPTCTDGMTEFAVTGSAPNFSVAVTSPGTFTLTCRFIVSAAAGPAAPAPVAAPVTP